MATIRIYKVAEVLGISSQEIIDLLRKEHGIEVKSASSTIEEIVARQFAERLARERALELPSGQLFSDKPVRRTTKRSKSAKARAEPPAPPKPRLGPPRLIKAAKAAKAEEAEAAKAEAETAKGAAPETPAVEIPVASETPVAATPTVATRAPEPVQTEPSAVGRRSPPRRAQARPRPRV